MKTMALLYQYDIKCTSFDYDFHQGIQFLHPTIPSDVRSAFKKYKKHHNRKYKGEEHEMRKNIFKDNWEFINDHNSKNLGYVLEVNEFADKRYNELRYLTGIRSFDEVPIKSRKGHNGPIKAHNNSHKSIKAHKRSGGPPIRDRDGSNGPIKGSPYTEEELPENFDLRMLGVISPVQNQAHCGSCWAFAAAATLEGAIAHSNGGRILDFSEQALVDCAWDYDCEGCQGTLSIGSVFEYVKAHGIPTVDEYGPYLEEDGYCKVGNMSHLQKIKSAEEVTPNDEEALKTAIYKYGPVALGVHVSQAMIFYKSGIFYDPECPVGGINHAVSAIGYGYKDGELFWVIKNSWGESWGSDGYLYITAKNDNCNVMMTPYYVIVTD
ncbi:cathepsin L1-like [Hyposmocoma kahamanoa]|uniref:cathepsin L1-like n=1 Tax=Hyposmocoma kahamanoa TaxID=1477025 RepID=UPI000E6D631D|nr:cathepsin L1-like [Hyposmocoma kahamanoa]